MAAVAAAAKAPWSQTRLNFGSSGSVGVGTGMGGNKTQARSKASKKEGDKKARGEVKPQMMLFEGVRLLSISWPMRPVPKHAMPWLPPRLLFLRGAMLVLQRCRATQLMLLLCIHIIIIIIIIIIITAAAAAATTATMALKHVAAPCLT
jgi:hypothetical protein